jgi:hypothetical protein
LKQYALCFIVNSYQIKKQGVNVRYLSAAFTLLILTGCASTEVSSTDPAPASADRISTTQTAEQSVQQTETSDEKLVCRYEKTIGSNKKVRTCRKVSGT